MQGEGGREGPGGDDALVLVPFASFKISKQIGCRAKEAERARVEMMRKPADIKRINQLRRLPSHVRSLRYGRYRYGTLPIGFTQSFCIYIRGQ